MKEKLIFLLLLTVVPWLGAQTSAKQLFNEAAQKVADRKYREAIQDYSRVLEKKSEITDGYLLANTYLMRGFCRAWLGNANDALKDMNAAQELKPEYSKVYSSKAEVLKMFGFCAEGIVEVKKALELKPEEEDYICLLADCFYCSGEKDTAIIFYDKALSINPKNQKANRGLADVYYHKKLYEQAIKLLDKVIETDPRDALAYFRRGMCKAQLKDFKGAEEDMLYGKEKNPEFESTAYNNIAFFIKFEQEDYRGAIEFFNKAISLTPELAYSWNNRGFAKYKLSDYKGAVKDIKKSLELDPKNSYAWKNLGLVYLAEGRQEEACRQWKKAMELGYGEDYDNEVTRLLEEHCGK